MIDLPIDKHLDEIRLAVDQHGNVIVEAPPGTGKTTRVRTSILTHDARQQTILVQPRRIAARTAASRIAAELGTAIGQRVGYQVRFDRRTSAQTELVCMTPGILLRKLQHDPLLDDVRHVLLDEFHERSVEYDLLLGMLRRVQLEVRPDLKIVLMSATLDSDTLATYLNGSPVIRVTAETFPVSIRHKPLRSTRRGTPRGIGLPRQIAESTAAVTLEAMQQHEGDCLVFLPGVGEIHRVAELVESTARKHGWYLFTLYGDMRPEDQDRVLQPMDRRKLILSTNVAETSLTIDGIRMVIDSGYARVQRFDPGAGLDALQLEPISIASARQRTGRAGRTAPGVCYRLWDKATERSRADHLEPEIKRVDLAGPALQLLCWGEHDLTGFLWLTRPHADSIQQALELLQWLGAIHGGKPTDLGRKMLKLPVHPRLARLLVAGHEMGIPHASALAAAILSEREIFVRPDGARTHRNNVRRPIRVPRKSTGIAM